MAAQPPRFSTEGSRKGPPATEVLDEAAALLRRTPLSLLSIYYLGALPFWLAFVYFYFDMTQSADAETHLAGETMLLTVLYFCMKTCQAVFSRKLLALLEGDDAEPWNKARLANTALLQVIYAGSYVIVYPLALLTTIPFGWVNAFYHNISIVATGPGSTVRSSFSEAVDLSRLWPRQNHLILGIVLAALLFLFLNLAVFLSLLPRLLNMFFGIVTVFDENGLAWQNSSFYLDVFVLCYLVVNPLNKATYVLRCFYGRARLDGADLKAELRRQEKVRQGQALKGVIAALSVYGIAAFFAAPAQASPNAPPGPAPVAVVAPAPADDNLDRAIQKTLQKDEFAWRLPREESVEPQKEGFLMRALDRFFKFLGDMAQRLFKFIGKLIKWLFGGDRKVQYSHGSWQALSGIPWRLLFCVILALVVGCLFFILARHFRRTAQPKEARAPVSVRTVDLEAENVRADALPEDSWLELAQEMMGRGELRLALRALYLATLSLLAQCQFIRLGPAKSNRDYLSELTRRLRGNAAALQLVRENIRLFEASWYGTHAVNTAIIETMLANHQQVRGHATV